jgi:hypothetical protein
MRYQDILETPTLITRSWHVEHLSSNIASLNDGFRQRELGVSFARIGREKPYSSPTRTDSGGEVGLVTATVDGHGLDYEVKEHKTFLTKLYKIVWKTQDSPYDIAMLRELRKRDVDWVAGWNGIGASDELHVLNVARIHITLIT